MVVGGCGHAGLPLGLAFCSRGFKVGLYDLSEAAVESVRNGLMPFADEGCDEVLTRVLAEGRLEASTDAAIVGRAENIVVVIGTPIDEHLNPAPQEVPRAIEGFKEELKDGQLLVLGSTVYPGVTKLVEKLMQSLDLRIDVVFCPERIAEGKALMELFELPQIVSGRTDHASDRAEKLYRNLTGQVIRLLPEEAELAKLFTNTWRYIKFATANQLYMIANDFGLDFERIRSALAFDYPRAADMPGAGFAAGPCLLKDTMQLAAFNNNNFILGHAAMMVNEGLPLYLVSRMDARFELEEMTVGILGMAFKAESDDIRSSLSYKLKRILKFKAAGVLCTDPYVHSDPDLVPLEEVMARANLLVVGAPHGVYRSLKPSVPVVDIWNALDQGALV